MAIAARTNPELIVTGSVEGTRELKSNSTGEVFGKSVTVKTAGGNLYVTMWDRNQAPVEVGGSFAAVVSVEESARGSQLSFARELNQNDLELLLAASGLGASVK